ncbi:hypothetical protein EV426DRAFT_567771 [Tirmania nivea]|nr:hypothetical protein EV426DRAFT_567771 [Tirmania nivea]
MRNLVQFLWGPSPNQTPSSSASAASSTVYSPAGTRDRDLISTDEFLTDDILDEIWTWFRGATKDWVDPQLVFVKMINSARKPYVDHLTSIQPPTPATPKSGVSDIFNFWRRGSSASSTCYTPSERTVTDHYPPSYEHEFYEPVNPETHQALQATIAQLRQENVQLENKVNSLTSTITKTVAPPPLCVAIKSVQFGGRYVSMNGSGIRSQVPGGGGHVKVQTFIGGWETFELVCHPEERNIVSFKSTCFDNVFIRAESKGLGRGQTPGHGGGLVNCQYGCGKLEKFRILNVGEHGEVAIEPMEFPGRFFRVDGNWLHGMNLQGMVSGWEKFYLVVVP